MRKFDFTADQANHVNSILYGISAIASPLLGLVVDKTGWNLLWVFVSITVTIGAHLLLAFTFLNPLIAMVRLRLVDLFLFSLNSSKHVFFNNCYCIIY